MAFGNATFSAAGSAVSDIFAAFGHEAKQRGDLAEAGNYDQAAVLADLNAQYTKSATAIKQAQADRQVALALGEEKASIASTGFSESGSALDILRDSAAQGALQHAALGEQGQITEAGYHTQAASYRSMADAARDAAHAEGVAATGSYIGAAISGAAMLATLL